MGGLLLIGAREAHAGGPGWVETFSELRLRPSFGDARASLADRLALARALGRHGPERDAVAALLSGLERDPPPVLRDELLLALARRAAPEAGDALRGLLADDERSPASLALALGSARDAPTIDALVRALGREPSAKVAEEALLRIGAACAPRVAAALATRELALSAARVLGALGPEAIAARAALERALAADDAALRAAAATALGAIGAQASAAALAARLKDEPRVVEAALGALARVASREQAPALAALLTSAGEQRPLALRAFAAASPQRAVPALASALRASDAAQRTAAVEVLEGERPDASWIPLLAARVRNERSEGAASALARVEGGAGLPALLQLASETAARPVANTGTRTGSTDAGASTGAGAGASTGAGAGLTDVVVRALAIGVRRFAEGLDDELREAALARLRGLPKGERRLLLRALARDETVVDELATALRAPSAEQRATAAAAARMLGDEQLAGAVRAALLREHEPEAVRRLCEAALALGAELSYRQLEPWLTHSETAPEAAALAATRLRAAPPRELRVALRRMLDPGRAARARSGAAWALAALGDAGAWPALVATLDDPAAPIRLAAVHALARLGGADAERALREHARVERDALVRTAARDALASGARAAGQDRSRVLEARVRTEASADSERPLVDVLLEDGRWLRMRTLPGGELLLEDLAAGHADVRVVP